MSSDAKPATDQDPKLVPMAFSITLRPDPVEMERIHKLISEGQVAALAQLQQMCQNEVAFTLLRYANIQRQKRWHNNQPWNAMEWGCAMAGEAGEACNAAKKFHRIATGIASTNNPASLEDARANLKTEIGDTLVYLDLMAHECGIDLAEAVRDTFNRVSIREGFPERI